MALEVIGAGFPRNGTMSLRAAFEKLGYAPSYHMSEVIAPRPGLNDGHIEADHEICIRAYERHNEEVKRTIPADRLLVFDLKEGWEPL